MKRFFKKNWLILIVLAVAIFEIVCSFLLCCNNYKSVFDVINSVSLSYIAAFVFYVVQVYIPEEKKRSATNQCVKIYIDKICYEIDNMYKELANGIIEIKSDNSYLKDDMEKIAMIELSSEINVNKADTIGYGIGENIVQKFTRREWIINCTAEINEEINNVMNYFGGLMEFDIINALEQIRNTNLMTSLRYAIRSDRVNKIGGCFHYELYKAGKNLRNTFIKQMEQG